LRHIPSWFFDLDRRRASLIASLVISFAFTLVRIALANDKISLLIALAVGVFAFGLALILYVESGNYHEKVERWRELRQKDKIASRKAINLASTQSELHTIRVEIDQIMQYLATRRMLSFDVNELGNRAANMAAEGYLRGIAKNKARFAPGKEYFNE